MHAYEFSLSSSLFFSFPGGEIEQANERVMERAWGEGQNGGESERDEREGVGVENRSPHPLLLLLIFRIHSHLRSLRVLFWKANRRN